MEPRARAARHKGTLNFGQGEALMLGALVGLSLVGSIHGGPYLNYWLMLPVVIVFGGLQGAFVERIAIRPALKIKSEFGWIMSTMGEPKERSGSAAAMPSSGEPT